MVSNFFTITSASIQQPFPGEPGSASCPLVFFLHLFWKSICEDKWHGFYDTNALPVTQLKASRLVNIQRIWLISQYQGWHAHEGWLHTSNGNVCNVPFTYV